MDFTQISAAEAEFYAQNQLIGILPKVNSDSVHLISGTFGPFKTQKPVDVPLWLALEFKKKDKCSIMCPSWLDESVIMEMIQAEKTTTKVGLNELQCKLPDFYFFEIAIVLYRDAQDDIIKPSQIRTLLEDLYELRRKKIMSNITE